MTSSPALVSNPTVEVNSVSKWFGQKVAVSEISCSFGPGLTGLLGPNGAGKTTLVKIMMTVVQPTSAVGTVLGRPLGNKRKRERIGYLPENHQFPRYLTGWQLLDSYAALARVPKKVRRQRAGELLERMGLNSWADIRIGRYSKGMIQRLGLAQALMNDPDLIVLDEPTDGVDPMGRRDIRELLLEYRDRGKTIFINSHLLSELEMVCDRVSILVDGLVARQGRLGELTEHSIEYHIFIEGELASLATAVAELGGRIEQKRIVVAGHDARLLNRFIDMLRDRQRLIEAVEPRRFSLEEIFVDTLRGQKGLPTVGRDARKGRA